MEDAHADVRRAEDINELQVPPNLTIFLKFDGPLLLWGVSDRDGKEAAPDTSPFPLSPEVVRQLELALHQVACTMRTIRRDFAGPFWMTGAEAADRQPVAEAMASALAQASTELTEAANIIRGLAGMPGLASIFEAAAARAGQFTKKGE